MPFLIDSVSDGAEPARLRRPPDHPPGHRRSGATTTATCSRSSRPAPRRPRTRSPSRSSTPRSTARPTPRELDALQRRTSSACSARCARPSRTGRRCARRRSTSPPSSTSSPPPRRARTRSPRPSAFLDWLEDDHFTFLGYREYELVDEDGELTPARRCRASGWASCARRRRTARAASSGCRRRCARCALEPYLLNLTKANSRSTVHRPRVPRLRRRQALRRRRPGDRRAALPRPLHAHRLPREPAARSRSCAARSTAILAARRLPAGQPQREGADRDPRDATRATSCSRSRSTSCSRSPWASCTWASASGCGCSCAATRSGASCPASSSCRATASTPRTARRIERILREAFGAREHRLHDARVGVRARAPALHGLRRARRSCRDHDARELESRLVAATRSWARRPRGGADRGARRGARQRAAPAATATPSRRPTARTGWPRSAVADIGRIEELPARTDLLACSLYRPLEAPAGALRAQAVPRRAAAGAVRHAADVREHGRRGRRRAALRGHARATARPSGSTTSASTYSGARGAPDRRDARGLPGRLRPRLARRRRERRLQPARPARRADLARGRPCCARSPATCARRGTTFSDRYVEQALVAHPRDRPPARRAVLARASTRSGPTRARGRRGSPSAIERGDRRGREPRPGPDPAQLPRRRSQAMLRTNYFQRDDGRQPQALPLVQARPARLPWLPLPRPQFEIFVYSPRVEGVHLRGGKVARGGIRWSDRREDFRTEVLGLMKAQMVKNAVIVPVGAKGGFVVKRPPDGRREALHDGGRRLLPHLHPRAARPHRQHRRRRDRAARRASCATTTTIPTSSSPPTRAPPRSPTSPTRSPPSTASGSATRSPRAARAATTTRRWASPRAAPGSRSSATSASSGTTSSREDFTVVGIGDMSGDVFGNGMLLSPHIRLVAAFDHRHVFLDPDPDSERAASPSASACSSCRARRGPTTTPS